MNNNKSLFAIGFIVFLSIVMFIGGNYFLQNKHSESSHFTFNVYFENVQGLRQTDPVQFFGIEIGMVKDIKINKKRKKAVAVLSISNEYANTIPVDSKFEVKEAGLLGERFILITSGEDENDFIGAGETVFGTYEGGIGDISSGIKPITENVVNITEQLNKLLAEGEIGKIKQTISNIESMTRNIDDFMVMSNDIISDQDRKKIKDIINDLSSTSSKLRVQLDKDVSNIIDNMNTLSESAPEVKELIENLNNTSKTFEKSAESIDKVVSNIEDKNNTIGKLLHEDSLYVNLNGLILDLRILAKDMHNDPGKYMKSIFK